MIDYNPADERSTDLETIVCRDGRHVNVRNTQSGSGEIHTVTVDDGHAVGCTCKGFKFHDHCYHANEIESRPLIVSSAQSLAASYSPVAADGGVTTDDEGETCDWCPTLLADSHDRPAGYTAVTLDDEELCSDCADDYYERDGCTCEDCQ